MKISSPDDRVKYTETRRAVYVQGENIRMLVLSIS